MTHPLSRIFGQVLTWKVSEINVPASGAKQSPPQVGESSPALACGARFAMRPKFHPVGFARVYPCGMTCLQKTFRHPLNTPRPKPGEGANIRQFEVHSP